MLLTDIGRVARRWEDGRMDGWMGESVDRLRNKWLDG